MDEIIRQRLDETVEWLKKEYEGIRTGQATPALLDKISIDQYESRVPLNQVGSLSIEDARTLRLSLWDKNIVAVVEKAIKDADLGVSVISDSGGLRVIFPELTSERRSQLIKLAKSKLEDARVSVRGIRDDILKDIEKQKKAGEMSEDDFFKNKAYIQKEVDSSNNKLEIYYQKKEQEINK